MAAISLRGITNYILQDFDLTIAERELLVVVGPSGAGKTTLLEVVAGLTNYRGQVRFDDVCVDRLPAHCRQVGYVFQDLLLFPHLTLRGNIQLAMHRSRDSRRVQRQRVEEILDFFHMAHLADRYPRDLSGGEQQRAALARAVATRPQILLLDEPFASLDFRTSRYVRQELRRQQRRLGLTTLFVTHNLAEARELADRIAVIRDGRLELCGSPDEVWYSAVTGQPGFLEKPNLLACTDAVSLNNGLIEVRWAGGTLLVPDEGLPVSQVAILPHEVYISVTPAPGPPINRFVGRVVAIEHVDGVAQVTVAVGTQSLRVELSRTHVAALNVSIGQQVHGILKLRAVRGC